VTTTKESKRGADALIAEARAELEREAARERAIQNAKEVVSAYDREQAEKAHQQKVDQALAAHAEIQVRRAEAREDALKLGIAFMVAAREAEALLAEEIASRNVARTALAGPNPVAGTDGSISLDLNAERRGVAALIPEIQGPVAPALNHHDEDPTGVKGRLKKAGLLENPGGRDDLGSCQAVLGVIPF
jgi:hypothetical protein